MDLIKNVAGSVTKAVNFVVDQNRRAAMINRLKIVIRNEKEAQARSYIELGKYYYHNLRDSQNEQTEPLCTAADNAERRLKRAFTKLDELVAPADCGYEDEIGEDTPQPPTEEDLSSAEADEPDEDEFLRPFSEAQRKNETGFGADEEAADDLEPGEK